MKKVDTDNVKSGKKNHIITIQKRQSIKKGKELSPRG